MSFVKLFQRTTLPFDNGSKSALTPLTDKSRVAPLFGDTPLITDILNNNVTKNVDIHGRGSWGNGEDDFTSFKERGDEFMIDDKISEIIKRINEKKGSPSTKWIVHTVDGKEIEFPDQDTAHRKIREKKIPYKSIVKKIAQSHYHDFIDNAINATFEILSYSGNIKEIGAAFCIGDGIFMTCAHCIKKYNKMSLPQKGLNGVSSRIFLSKNGKEVQATLMDINFEIDVAIVKCSIKSPVLSFGLSKDTEIGTRVFTVGTPSGFEENVTEGILSSKNRVVFQHSGAPKYLFTDAHVLPGSSGGALISEDDGKVIGMMALIVSGSGLYGLNAAIPSETLQEFLNK